MDSGDQFAIGDSVRLDLLSGPRETITLNLPRALTLRLTARASEHGLSDFIAGVLAREERRLLLREWLDDMDGLHGSPTPAESADTDRRIEEMWARIDSVH